MFRNREKIQNKRQLEIKLNVIEINKKLTLIEKRSTFDKCFKVAVLFAAGLFIIVLLIDLIKMI